MIVDIEKLTVDYTGIKALDDLSFGIDEGDFLGIIGPNGAGKSTLFKCMLGPVSYTHLTLPTILLV